MEDISLKTEKAKRTLALARPEQDKTINATEKGNRKILRHGMDMKHLRRFSTYSEDGQAYYNDGVERISQFVSLSGSRNLPSSEALRDSLSWNREV